MKKLSSLFTAFFIVTGLLGQQRVLEVRDEPRHHLIFENDYVRLLDVHLGPNDTTRYHRHHTPSVFILLSTTNTASQLLGGQPVAGSNVSGEVLFDSLNKERIHRVWNVDTVWMHVIDAEIKAKSLKQKLTALEFKQLTPLFTEGMLNGYKFSLAANESLQFPNSAAGYLIVSLGDAEVTIESNGSKERYFMKAGHYSWVGTNKKLLVHNHGNAAADFAVLQF